MAGTLLMDQSAAACLGLSLGPLILAKPTLLGGPVVLFLLNFGQQSPSPHGNGSLRLHQTSVFLSHRKS